MIQSVRYNHYFPAVQLADNALQLTDSNGNTILEPMRLALNHARNSPRVFFSLGGWILLRARSAVSGGLDARANATGNKRMRNFAKVDLPVSRGFTLEACALLEKGNNGPGPTKRSQEVLNRNQ
jgi:hypothetical protein